jgi:homotetrameric cytidine deaminase
MDEPLMNRARDAAQHAYCPYSRFQVGAALLMKDETVYTGCNVENSSYSLSMCAERVALYKAVCDGQRKGDFLVLAVAGRMMNGDWQFCPPCGACRQVLAEFSSSQNPLWIIYMGIRGEIKKKTMDDLLPDGFFNIR